MKILSLDYGNRRIGVAITDPEQTVCFPRTVWVGLSQQEAIEKIKTMVGEEGVGEIIVGWPMNLKGEATRQTVETEVFFAELKKQMSIPVVAVDERFTSLLATQRDGDDAVAAQILLEGYLSVLQSKHESS